jgi:hypothetical protein
VVEIKEAMLLITLRPLTQFPLHFADIHQRFLRVNIRLPLLWNSDKLRPFAVWLAFPTSDYYGRSDAHLGL